MCLEPGCPEVQPESRCKDHRRAKDKARGSAAERGYGQVHRATRAQWAPMVATGHVRCWRCGEPIEAGAAWDLGHDDEDRSKYRGPEHVGRECAKGGNRSTAGRRHGTQVTVVCGPPCSGKTTWVRERAQSGDLIVDYDDIAQRLGSRRTHNHEHKYHRRVEATIARALSGIKAGRHDRAWVIRSLPAEAERLADELGGTVVLIDAPDEVLLERARRRPDPARTARAIREWRSAVGISPRA